MQVVGLFCFKVPLAAQACSIGEGGRGDVHTQLTNGTGLVIIFVSILLTCTGKMPVYAYHSQLGSRYAGKESY